MSFAFFSPVLAVVFGALLFISLLLMVLRIFAGRSTVVRYCPVDRRRKVMRIFSLKSIVSAVLLFFAALSLVIALFQPQWGRTRRERAIFGVDVMFCLDISNSMLAKDLGTSRLEYAKLFILNTVSRYPENTYGISLFKGGGTVTVPLTQDARALRRYVESIQPGLSTLPGTNIEDGIDAALNGFVRTRPGKEFLFLISDGEGLQGDPLEQELISKAGAVQLWCFAAGTEEGGTIELSGEETVYTRAYPEVMARIAAGFGGEYFNMGKESALASFEDKFSEALQKERQVGYEFVKQDRTPLFITAGLVLLFLYIIIRSIPWAKLF